MNAFRMILTAPRFLKVIALLGFMYVFAAEFLHRLCPKVYERMMGTCGHAVLRFLGIKLVSRVHCTQPYANNTIYICNHSSSFEIFMVPCLFKNTDFVITSEALKVPFFNRIFKKCPLIFVKGRTLRERVEGVQKIHEQLKKNRNVMMFPEGRSYKYLGPEFAKGAFQVAMESGCSITPVYLHYDNLDVFVPDEVVSHKKEFLRIISARNKKVTAHFFDPISPADYSDVTELRDAVYNQYRAWQKRFYGC